MIISQAICIIFINIPSIFGEVTTSMRTAQINICLFNYAINTGLLQVRFSPSVITRTICQVISVAIIGYQRYENEETTLPGLVTATLIGIFIAEGIFYVHIKAHVMLFLANKVT